MEAPSGYVCLNTDEVIRRCELAINEIKAIRQKDDDEFIAQYIEDYNYWSFLPWREFIDKEQAKRNIANSKNTCYFFRYPSIYGDRFLDNAEKLLEAALATHLEVMWIASGAYILLKKFKETSKTDF